MAPSNPKHIERIQQDVANAILPLFEDIDTSPSLNLVDDKTLSRDLNTHYESELELVKDADAALGATKEIDPRAIGEERVVELIAPVYNHKHEDYDEHDAKKLVNDIREEVQAIPHLTEVHDKSGERMRPGEAVEQTIPYRFVYVLDKDYVDKH